jgi:hypothetical protein
MPIQYRDSVSGGKRYCNATDGACVSDPAILLFDKRALSLWLARIVAAQMAWTAIGEPTAWPEPDTHDEWRKLNGE